jgi:cytochrome c peroxidase
LDIAMHGPTDRRMPSGTAHVPAAAFALLMFSLLMFSRCADAANSRLPQRGTDGLGLPPVVAPAAGPETPALVALGRRLFLDKRLSLDGSVSCSTCHRPDHAFSDGRALAQGIDKRQGTRNAPSLFNVAYNTSQFWDGREPSLEAQALDPFKNPLEHGLKDDAALLGLVRSDSSYAEAFRAAFPAALGTIEAARIAQALAAFERTLLSGDSSFDRYYYAGDGRALSASAQRGLRLFQGAALCDRCHVIGRHDALFTDNAFHSVSIGLQRIAPRLPELTRRLVEARQSGTRIDQAILSDPDLAELGHFAVTLRPADIGTFRTPSLRNVALTAPYMHDGSVATLEDAIDRELYFRGSIGRPLILTPGEKADLADFLRALTGPAARAGYLGPKTGTAAPLDGCPAC